MLDVADEPSYHVNDVDASMKSMTSKKSKRGPIPNKWTRVINIDDVSEVENEIYNINEDLDKARDEIVKHGSRKR